VNDSFVASLIAFEVDDAMVREGRAIEMFGARFTPLRLLHGRLPVLGWRIDLEPGMQGAEVVDPASGGEAWRDAFPLAWCTDVSAIPPETWPRLTGLRTLVLDALRHRKHPTHLTLDEAVTIADRVGAARTYFVHMAHDLPHAATQDDLPEGMFLAHDGLAIGAARPAAGA
jgi:phosphoribosyl 1,2-cyclic phosphate phosphodiesterase